MEIKSKTIVGKAIISPAELKQIYLYGVDTVSNDGRQMPNEVFEFFIKSAQEEIENFLEIKMIPTTITETLTYRYDDVISWGRLDVSFPVVSPISVKGRLGNVQRIEYPSEWLVSRQSSDNTYFRTINIVPSSYPVVNTPTMLGVLPLSMYTDTGIPMYWEVSYTTGFSKIPSDIMNFIGKLASCNVLHSIGDSILGVGILSKSISIDGISQSISSTKSSDSSVYGARIKAYLSDIEKSMAKLSSRYRGIKFGVL